MPALASVAGGEHVVVVRVEDILSRRHAPLLDGVRKRRVAAPAHQRWDAQGGAIHGSDAPGHVRGVVHGHTREDGQDPGATRGDAPGKPPPC